MSDIRTGYRDILHLRGRIVGAYEVVSAMLPDIHTGYRNTLHLREHLVGVS